VAAIARTVFDFGTRRNAACFHHTLLLPSAVQPNHAHKRSKTTEHTVEHENTACNREKRWCERDAVVGLKARYLLPVDERLRVGLVLPPTPDVESGHGDEDELGSDDGRCAVFRRWVAPFLQSTSDCVRSARQRDRARTCVNVHESMW
jgi:hypothetical protein